MNMPKQKSLSQLQKEVDLFNSKFPVGSEVALRIDSGETKITKVEHAAYVAGGHSAVAFFEGVSGYYLIDRASKISG